MVKNARVVFAAVTFGILVTWSVGAGAEPDDANDAPALVTDRPDFTESSSAVPASHLQLEFGSHLSAGESSTELAPANLLARYGLVDRVELRLGVTPVVAEFGGEESVRGLEDVTLGAKIAGALAERLRVGLIPWAKVGRPVDGATYSSGAIGTIALGTGSPVSLAANVGAGYQFGRGTESGVEGSGSVAVGISLPAGFGTFVEAYGIAPSKGDLDVFADAGLTYRVAPPIQLDGFVAAGVPEFQSVSGGLGVSFIL